MYIQIVEERVDNLMEHLEKSAKCIHKAVECLSEWKEDYRMGERHSRDDEDDDYEMDERYGNRGRSMSGRSGMRGGRYSRY